MRRKLVIGNWKMNGTRADARAWTIAASTVANACSNVDVGVLPPYLFVDLAVSVAHGSKLMIGAQNLAAYTNGAYTGEISGAMLFESGAQVVLVGHSERRHVLGESDAVVAQKFAQAQAAGITPVLCLGESLTEREANETEVVVLRQLNAVISVAGAAALSNAILAYEPVWAIGTGRTASPEQAQAVHALIRGAIAQQDVMLASRIRVLYGGSVKGSNAAELFGQPDVDGGLIGGASLVAADFAAICNAANQDG